MAPKFACDLSNNHGLANRDNANPPQKERHDKTASSDIQSNDDEDDATALSDILLIVEQPSSSSRGTDRKRAIIFDGSDNAEIQQQIDKQLQEELDLWSRTASDKASKHRPKDTHKETPGPAQGPVTKKRRKPRLSKNQRRNDGTVGRVSGISGGARMNSA